MPSGILSKTQVLLCFVNIQWNFVSLEESKGGKLPDLGPSVCQKATNIAHARHP